MPTFISPSSQQLNPRPSYLGGFTLMSNSLDGPAYLLGIAKVFVTNRSQLGIEFIQQRYPGGDVQVHDVVIADLVEMLHQGSQAVAMSGDEHSLTSLDG
jgi:hypothetical protein